MLSEGAVAFEEFVEHATKAEPVGRRIVCRSFGKNLGCHVSMGAHRGVRLLLTEVTCQAQVGDPHVAVFIEENVGGFEITVNDESAVHVFQAQDHLCGIELHLVFVEDAVL